MKNLVHIKLLPGNMTLWSVDFNLDFGIEDICSLISVFYFNLYSFNFYSFIFVINMSLWVLMAEMIGDDCLKHSL